MTAAVIALIALIAAYLALIAPGRLRRGADAPEPGLYAHRGLHDAGAGVPENSMEAFSRASRAGYGIELDVQLTSDGRLVVFHDETLERVCGVPGRLCDISYEGLISCPLPDGSRIPLFSEVLELIDGSVPLIVEIKFYSRITEVARAALTELSRYSGPYCVESFHPLIVRYFMKNAPGVARGQLAQGGKWRRDKASRFQHFVLKHLLVNAIGRPHFVAYRAEGDKNLSVRLMKSLFRPIMAAWTIKSQALLDSARRDYDILIFDSFIPDSAPPSAPRREAP